MEIPPGFSRLFFWLAAPKARGLAQDLLFFFFVVYLSLPAHRFLSLPRKKEMLNFSCQLTQGSLSIPLGKRQLFLLHSQRTIIGSPTQRSHPLFRLFSF